MHQPRAPRLILHIKSAVASSSRAYPMEAGDKKDLQGFGDFDLLGFIVPFQCSQLGSWMLYNKLLTSYNLFRKQPPKPQQIISAFHFPTLWDAVTAMNYHGNGGIAITIFVLLIFLFSKHLIKIFFANNEIHIWSFTLEDHTQIIYWLISYVINWNKDQENILATTKKAQ